MAKKNKLTSEVDKIKAELEILQRKKSILDSKPTRKKTTKTKPKATKPKTTKPKTTKTKPKATKPKTTKSKPKATKPKTTKSKTTKTKPKATKPETKPKATKPETKPKATKPETKPKATKAKPKATKAKPEETREEKTFEEELEEQLSNEEIENFQIEKVDMEMLTRRVCDIIADKEHDGMLQNDLWKKLKLTNRDGSRLALKLERMGTITREKILEKGRWTYKLILKKTPISTQSLENAPCLVCTVEQKCSLEGEISPRTCQLIEDWVLAEIKKPKKSK